MYVILNDKYKFDYNMTIFIQTILRTDRHTNRIHKHFSDMLESD